MTEQPSVTLPLSKQQSSQRYFDAKKTNASLRPRILASATRNQCIAESSLLGTYLGGSDSRAVISRSPVDCVLSSEDLDQLDTLHDALVAPRQPLMGSEVLLVAPLLLDGEMGEGALRFGKTVVTIIMVLTHLSNLPWVLPHWTDHTNMVCANDS